MPLNRQDRERIERVKDQYRWTIKTIAERGNATSSKGVAHKRALASALYFVLTELAKVHPEVGEIEHFEKRIREDMTVFGPGTGRSYEERIQRQEPGVLAAEVRHLRADIGRAVEAERRRVLAIVDDVCREAWRSTSLLDSTCVSQWFDNVKARILGRPLPYASQPDGAPAER